MSKLCGVIRNAFIICLGLSTIKTSAQTNQAPQLPENTNTPGAVISRDLLIEAGTTLLAPFSISPSVNSPGKFALKNQSADIRGMIEVDLLHRKAWHACTFSTNQEDAGFFWTLDDMESKKKTPSFDIELRGGFAFAGSGSQSSPSIGAGDGFGEASLGLNLIKWRGEHEAYERPEVITFNFPEFFGSFVTDRSYSLVHPAGGVGAAIIAAIPWNKTNSNEPPIEVVGRCGAAWIDSPVLSGTATGSGGTETIVTPDSNGGPLFDMKAGLQFRVDTRIPISIDTKKSFGYLTMGGTYYQLLESGHRDPWSMYLAMTISPQTLFSGLRTAIGSFGESASN